MLSLQSFLREGRVVGLWWAKLKPKRPKGNLYIPLLSVYLGILKNLKDLKNAHPLCHPDSANCSLVSLHNSKLQFGILLPSQSEVSVETATSHALNI